MRNIPDQRKNSRYLASENLTNDSKCFIDFIDRNIYQQPVGGFEHRCSDKWLAVSSLHKSIRRGDTKLALHATATLLRLDPNYLLRRLPIIAFEDVGIANPFLCNLVLFATARNAQKSYGRDKLAYLLTKLLAESIKSRAATDIFCLTVSDPYAKSYFESCLSLHPSRLVDIALSKDLNLTHRMAAIRLITGYSIRRSNGFTQTITKGNPDQLQSLCEAMNLSDAFEYQVLNGNKRTEGLNGAILLANELLMESPTSSVITKVTPVTNIGCMNAAAYDIYCRAGRDVICEFILKSQRLTKFFSDHHTDNPAKLVGTILFVLEGSQLNDELDFIGRAELRQEIECMEISQAGLKVRAQQATLSEILIAEMPLLDRVRRAYQTRLQTKENGVKNMDAWA